MRTNFYKKYLIVLLVAVALIAANRYLAGNYLQNIFYQAISGPGIFLNDHLVFVRKISNGLVNAKRVAEEVDKLKEENNVLQGKSIELESLRRENQFLRDQLGASRRFEAELLIVKIYNIQRNATSSSALLNKGSQDGVRKSMPVIAAGNVLVGLVEEVFDDSARILLLDDPRVKIGGRMQDSKILVKTSGRLGEVVGIDLVASGDEIKGGDLVITSGLDGLPESLPVAQITEVVSPNGALFKTVTARPLFDPSLGSNLFVILK